MHKKLTIFIIIKQINLNIERRKHLFQMSQQNQNSHSSEQQEQLHMQGVSRENQSAQLSKQQKQPNQQQKQSEKRQLPKQVQANNNEHENIDAQNIAQVGGNQANNQPAEVTAKKMDICSQKQPPKQKHQQKANGSLQVPTDDDISQFIISIKSSFKGQIFSMLQKFGQNIVNRIEPQTRQPALYFAGVLGDQLIAYELMEALLKHGANPNFKDQHQQTVLYYVCRQGKEKCVQLLLDYGLKIQTEDAYGQSPIYYAVSENRLGIVEKFANSKELLNHRDKLAGQTPLFYAAKKGHLQMAKLLLAKGSDPTIQDTQGKTAGQIAKRAKFPEVAELLLGDARKPKDQNKSAPQSEERINQNQSSQVQESKRMNKKKDTAAPKQSYKIVLMNSNGQLHDLTQQEVRQLVKGNPKLQSYLANPESIPQQEIDTSISQETWEKVAQKLLSNCWKLKGAYWFHDAVDPVKYNIMDYFDIISKPMDLGTVKKKLNHNVYEKAQDFVEDMRLVWQNCYRYNGEHHDISKCAKEIETAFEDGIKNFGLSKYL